MAYCWRTNGGDGIRLILDMDETICDFLGEVCDRYNQQTGSNLKVEDIDSWDLTKFIGEEGMKIFQQRGFFDKLKPYEGAIETIEKLYNEGFDIKIVTNPMNNPDIAYDKYVWINKHLPFLTYRNIIMTSEKHLIDADLIFDDCPEFLNNFPGTRVCSIRPYNTRTPAEFFVANNNWDRFYDIVHTCKKVKDCLNYF